MASPEQPSAKRINASVTPSPLGRLNDDLLADIFLRLPTLADVGRTATACATFRRVVADRTFLRRLHSVHPVPLLGLLLFSSVHPAEAPHSSAPYARALRRAADLSFSFVPCAGRWIPVDARDGRVLLEREAMGGDFAVCDPVFRRYLFLPHIPGHPTAQRCGRLEPFLVPASDEEAETSFRVVCVVERKPGQLVAFVFSSGTGRWGSLAVDVSVHPSCNFSWSSYAFGSCYWKVTGTNKFLVLDTRSMVFSSFDIPSGHGQQDSVIVEAAEGRIGMFTLHNSMISAASYLVYAVRVIHEEGNSLWQLKRRVRLPSQYIFSFADATDKHLLLRGIPWNLHLEPSTHDVDIGYFSVEFQSMQVEKNLWPSAAVMPAPWCLQSAVLTSRAPGEHPAQVAVTADDPTSRTGHLDPVAPAVPPPAGIPILPRPRPDDDLVRGNWWPRLLLLASSSSLTW